MKWWKVCALLVVPSSAARCDAFAGFARVEQSLSGVDATKLKFYGVSESDIEVSRLISDSPKIVVTGSSTAEVDVKVVGDAIEVRVGDCPDVAATTDSSAPTDSGHMVGPSALLLLGAMAAQDSKLALLTSGIILAAGAQAESTCNEFVTVEIHTPAAPSNDCTADPSGVNDAMETKLGIFDPPTSTEMEKIFDAFKAHDFTTDGFSSGEVEFHPILRAGVKGRTPKPDKDKILELFGGDSLATTQKTSPAPADGEPPIWGGIMTTYINRMDPCPQVKTDAVAHLYGSGAKLDRYACISVAFGGLATPKFTEYKVGPLDAASMTITKGDDQLWGSRPREGNEMLALKTMVNLILNEEDMKTIQMESFDGKWHGNGLGDHEPAPPGLLGHERRTQILVNFAIEGTWRGKDMNIVPLSFTIDNTDGDPSQWTAYDFYYNYQGPFTKDDLVAKYQSGELDKVTFPSGHYEKINGRVAGQVKNVVGTTWPARRDDMPLRKHASKSPPKSYMPDGARFEVKGRTVKWMDWEFHAGYTFRAGPDFKGITFKGSRIAYQIALSEVALQYAANDPVAGNVFFFDCTFGNGEFRELVKGVDCPEHATFIDNHWWAPNGGARHAKAATCIFEHATDSALWRRGGPFVAGQAKYELHVRQVVTNGNYDYMLTYKFRLDGSIDVDMESTGFLQTHYYPHDWPPANPMSNRLMDRSGGSLHDHTYTFKVDLDVGTETNTLKTMEFKVSDKVNALNTNVDEHWSACSSLDASDPFKCDAANKKVYTGDDVPYLLYPKARHVEFQTISTESAAKLNANPAEPKAWLLGDTTQLNKYGNVKTYRVKLHDIVQGRLPDDHHSMPANSMSKQNMAVTIRKESEQFATGAYDLNRFKVHDADGNEIDGSQMNVDMMAADDENIVQQDLVAWVACTTWHYPSSENVPMTSGIRHGFSLEPMNFFDENPSMDMPSYLRVMADEVGTERGCPDACEEHDPSGFERVCTPPQIDCTHNFAGVW